ncbi:MAG TPA: endonuclease/exonuclease/phosphatase family protein [Pyrinomonadaceae bacterium]|nr:endonuclease/exonuclease/phosphatase family protein [Pyrinomonadaceae bacterium]
MTARAMFTRSLISLLLLLPTLSLLTANIQAQTASAPLLTYNELVQLYEEPQPAPELANKLNRLLTTPFVSNTVGLRAVNAKPEGTVRVATWNIERGLEFDAVKAALTNDQRFFRRLPATERSSKFNLAQILEQARELSRADIIILNEVDWGLKRTDYRNVARDLATAMRMNYAFGVEFVEVDPLNLGIETLEGETSDNKQEMLRNMTVDKSRALNLHGTAILSRFPLRNVRIVRFVNQGHDWYAGEKNGISKLEKGKRKGAGIVFGEKVAREVRRGGRMMLMADVSDASIPGGEMTVVATHLEAKSKPSERLKQLEEVLAQIQPIDHPVVLAGDMNTSGSDSTPTSFEREVKKRLGSTKFWATQGIKYATGFGLLYDISVGLVNMQRVKSDPTVKSVKFVLENPEEKFFDTLKDFRFADGGAFDFRGSKAHSTGASGETLSDSNERASIGFASTLELRVRGRRQLRVALKLDWIFVKPMGLTDPNDKDQPFRFAPQFGRTLQSLNYSLKERISDHNPLIVDLASGQPVDSVAKTKSNAGAQQ